MAAEEVLLQNLDKLHPTEMGVGRIKKNLSLDTDLVVEWCRERIKSAGRASLQRLQSGTTSFTAKGRHDASVGPVKLPARKKQWSAAVCWLSGNLHG